MTPGQRTFWESFKAATGETADRPQDISAFGDSPEMADELLGLILIGQKRATCSLARWYLGPDADSELPRVGNLTIVLDGRDEPRCVLRITSVEIKPVRDTDAQFAWDEGEGDRTLEDWMQGHCAFWQREAEREGFTFSTDMDAVYERFELAWVPER
ncbi:ASCH domain-containing protein [Maricaulis sp.]|uniref:ASCH domain-containing protein n=1 Tax=Maricaulis sp. TaxID=1486257 RepID=UPI001B20D1DE|nr:ASCH domain-containing protein [Maricaulis sp.]MBO6796458.1 ASCH domain-containing protein [Maricaulis sp.]